MNRKTNKESRSIQSMACEFIKTRNERLFGELMKRLTPGLHKHIMDIERSNSKRADIINDTFSKAWDKIHQYNPDAGAFSTWVYKIAYNEALLSKRHENRTSYFEEFSVEKKTSVLEKVETRDLVSAGVDDESNGGQIIDDLYDLVHRVFHSIPDTEKFTKWKYAFNAKDLENRSFIEIAETMGENIHTVKGWVCKARRHIAKLIQEQFPTEYEEYVDYKYNRSNA